MCSLYMWTPRYVVTANPADYRNEGGTE